MLLLLFFFTYLTGPDSWRLVSVTRNDKTVFKINHFNIELYYCSQGSMLSILSATWQGSVSVILSFDDVAFYIINNSLPGVSGFGSVLTVE